MSPRKQAKAIKAKHGPSIEILNMLEGDIMVTAVGGQFAIGRLKADRETQEHVGCQRFRVDALRQACALAGATHRVFLYARVSHTTYLPFNCAEVSN